jgi:hypothetical protein
VAVLTQNRDVGSGDCAYAGSMYLSVTVTPHTAASVAALRAARERIPTGGSVCAALDAADPAGALHPDAYAEAVSALDVAARVFGYDRATDVGAHQADAAFLVDVAVYHMTGAISDVVPALTAFRRAAGPLLEGTEH